MVKVMWDVLILFLYVKNFILEYYFSYRKEVYISMCGDYDV